MRKFDTTAKETFSLYNEFVQVQQLFKRLKDACVVRIDVKDKPVYVSPDYDKKVMEHKHIYKYDILDEALTYYIDMSELSISSSIPKLTPEYFLLNYRGDNYDG